MTIADMEEEEITLNIHMAGETDMVDNLMVAEEEEEVTIVTIITAELTVVEVIIVPIIPREKMNLAFMVILFQTRD